MASKADPVKGEPPKDEPPADTRDALEVLESEAKEWTKDAEIDRILKAFRLDAYAKLPRPPLLPPLLPLIPHTRL